MSEISCFHNIITQICKGPGVKAIQNIPMDFNLILKLFFKQHDKKNTDSERESTIQISSTTLCIKGRGAKL
jgi:hypothetical protein